MRAIAVLLTAMWIAAGCEHVEPDRAGEGGSQTETGPSSSANTSAGGIGGASTTSGGLPDGPPCDVGGKAGVCIEVAACVGDYAPTPGFCAGPANIQCCIALTPGACDPSAMVVPEASLVEAPGLGGCPSGMIRVDAFCIDRYEAALVRVSDDVPWSPYFNPGATAVRAVSVKDAIPQGYIDQVRASAACEASGKRLCTDVEWLRACRGPTNTTYPYGDMVEPGVCNDHRAVHPAVEYFGTSDAWIYAHLDNACLSQLPDSLDATGANPGCVTAEGAFDMMGNLHEWTADPAGTFRGGFYVDTVKNGPGCLYVTTAHDVTHWDYSTGFRCCADP